MDRRTFHPGDRIRIRPETDAAHSYGEQEGIVDHVLDFLTFSLRTTLLDGTPTVLSPAEVVNLTTHNQVPRAQ